MVKIKSEWMTDRLSDGRTEHPACAGIAEMKYTKMFEVFGHLSSAVENGLIYRFKKINDRDFNGSSSFPGIGILTGFVQLFVQITGTRTGDRFVQPVFTEMAGNKRLVKRIVEQRDRHGQHADEHNERQIDNRNLLNKLIH
jgi:hypothetical protein